MKQELLRLEHIFCRYKQAPVLNGFRLRVFKGETLGILTMSELERTALFSLLNGKLPIDGGRIWFKEQPTTYREKIRNSESGISCIDCNASLITSLSVIDNITLFDQVDAPFQWVKERKKSKSVAPLLRKLEITPLVSKDTRNLRFFERIKLLLCRMLWQEAEIIVMEDCFSFCNEQEKSELGVILRELNDDGISVVLLGHDAADLAPRSDRLLVVQSGRTVLNVDSPESGNDIQPILTALVGGTIEHSAPGPTAGNKEVMSWENIRAATIESLNLLIHEGEIIALLDTDHSINDVVMDIMRGKENFSGRIKVGNNYPNLHTKASLRKNSIFLVPKDARELTIPCLSPLDNILLAIPDKLRRPGTVNPRIRNFLGEDLQARLSLDRQTFNRPLETQTEHVQFSVAFQMLRFFRPKVVVVEQPGIILPERSRRDLMQTLADLATEGCGILLLITSLNGVGRMAHHVYSGSKGRITG